MSLCFKKEGASLGQPELVVAIASVKEELSSLRGLSIARSAAAFEEDELCLLSVRNTALRIPIVVAMKITATASNIRASVRHLCFFLVGTRAS